MVVWDFDAKGDLPGLGSTVLRFGDRELWRKPVVYEGIDWFHTIVSLLRRKYGERLTDVVVGGGAYSPYCEDDSIPAGVDATRKWLRELAEASGRGVEGDGGSGMTRLPDDVRREYVSHPDDVPGIFALMDPMPGAVKAYHELAQRFDTYVVSTAPRQNPSAWSDKLLWVKISKSTIRRVSTPD